MTAPAAAPRPPIAPGRTLTWVAAAATAAVLTITINYLTPKFVIAAVAGIALGPLLLMRPDWALLLTAAAIPLEEAGVLFQSSPYVRLSIAKLLGLVAVGAWLLHAVLRREKPFLPRTAWALLAYLGAAALSLPYAEESKMSFAMFVRVATTVVFYLAAIHLVRTRRELVRLLAVLLTATALAAGFGAVQKYLPGFTYEQRTQKDIREKIYMGVERDTSEQQYFGREVLRSGGTTYHPLVLAFNVIVSIPLVAAGFLSARRGRTRFAAAAGLVALLAGLMASASRTGLVMLLALVALMVATGFVRLRAHVFFLALLAGLLAVPFLPEDFRTRVLDPGAYKVEHSTSLQGRLDLLQAGWRVFADHPVTGAGVGNLVAINRYMREASTDGYPIGAHNMYLQVALEMGIVGFAAFAWFIISSLRDCLFARRRFLRAGDPGGARMATALGLTIAAFLLYGLSIDLMALAVKNAWLMLAACPILARLAREAPAQEQRVA